MIGFSPVSLVWVVRQMKPNRMFSNCISVNFTVKQIHRLVLHFQRRVVQKWTSRIFEPLPVLHFSKTTPQLCLKMHFCAFLRNWKWLICRDMHSIARFSVELRESNPCPNISSKSFLHAYTGIICREMAGTSQTNHFLSCIFLSNRHSLRLQQPVFVLSRRRGVVTGEPARRP